jgi:hypothetical protein
VAFAPRVHGSLRDAGIRVVVTPVRAPNANACAERYRSGRSREECLGRPIRIGDAHYGANVAEFSSNQPERNHQVSERFE